NDIAAATGRSNRELDVEGERTTRWRSEGLDAGLEAAFRTSDVASAQRFLEADRAQRLVESLGGRRAIAPVAASPTFIAREARAKASAREAEARQRAAPNTTSQDEILARAAEVKTANLD